MQARRGVDLCQFLVGLQEPQRETECDKGGDVSHRSHREKRYRGPLPAACFALHDSERGEALKREDKEHEQRERDREPFLLCDLFEARWVELFG